MDKSDDYEHDYLDDYIARWQKEVAVKQRKKTIAKSLAGLAILGMVAVFCSSKDRIYERMPELREIDSTYVTKKAQLDKNYAGSSSTDYYKKINALMIDYKFKTDSIKREYDN